MVTITASVGAGGTNKREDVIKVQTLLNQNRARVPEAREITVDGIVGKETLNAITNFQRHVVGLSNPDGRVDPNGRTLNELNRGAGSSAPSPPPPPPPNASSLNITLRFPLAARPQLSYKTGLRYFGAPRKTSTGGHRSHAGCDLIAPKGTAILAVADGEVIQNPYYFYSGTNALEVRHAGGFVVRYGEISHAAQGVSAGKPVTRGQVIAYVGKLDSGSSMLHFEMYAGTASGALTVRSNQPFQRRSDLLDPTSYLDQATLT
ncbi:MAG: peptidoglycan DD-metalloendopeptidase family protein [Candidatus Competibacteraceae bacterium]